MARQIAHLDINSFFASIEQQANPYLRHKPIAIIKALGRTCVIAASYEAKKFGVKTGCRAWEAKSLCPQIIFVPADFDKYFPVTHQLIKICFQHCPTVEVFSLDEAFLDLTGFQNPISIIKKIQKAVALQIGDQITLSAGLSYNRLLAKLASDLATKNQILIITKKNKDQLLSSIQPSQICGIGPRIEARLAKMGITNLLQIRKIPQKYLGTSFGPWWAQQLKAISHGIDHSEVTPIEVWPEAKSVSRTFTLFQNTTHPKVIKATLRNLCEEVASKLRQMKMVSRTIGLGLRGGEFLGFHQERTLKEFTNDGRIIFNKAWQIFEDEVLKFLLIERNPEPSDAKSDWFTGHHWHLSVRFLGVWVTNLFSKHLLTPSLLPENQKREKILKAIDQVNTRFGSLTVFPGTLLGRKLIRPEVTGYLADKKLRFNNL